MMIGPNSSGLSEASIITAQPAWQLPMTQGFPSASGWRAMTISRNLRLGAGDILDRLAGHGFRQEADEIAGMPCLHRHADFAVGLETADARPVAGSRIDDDKGALERIDHDARRRNDADQHVVDRLLEGCGHRRQVRRRSPAHAGRCAPLAPHTVRRAAS